MKQIVSIILGMIVGSVGTYFIATKSCSDTQTECPGARNELYADSTAHDNHNSVIATLPIHPIQFSWDPLNMDAIYLGEINKKNSDDTKEGLWISYRTDSPIWNYLVLSHYHKGIKHGIEMIYRFVDGYYQLENMINYNQGALSSPIISFYGNGLVCGVITELSRIDDVFSAYVPKWMKKRYGLDSINQAYDVWYSEKGNFIDEGWYIFPNGEWQTDESEFVGKHISYKLDGEVTDRIFNAPE